MADILRVLELAERLGSLAESLLKAAVREQGLQSVHARMLLYLTRANRYSNSPMAVAEYLGLTKGTVSQSLILLEKKGLVERAADAHDRRGVRLFLTEAGQDLARAVAQSSVARLAEAGQALPQELLVTLTEMLRRLQLAGGRRSFGQCRTCRHHLQDGPNRWRCGLTGEPLTAEDGERICREHESAPMGERHR